MSTETKMAKQITSRYDESSVHYYCKISPVTGPKCLEGSRKLRFPDYVTMTQDGGKVVSLYSPTAFYPQEIPVVLISVRC